MTDVIERLQQILDNDQLRNRLASAGKGNRLSDPATRRISQAFGTVGSRPVISTEQANPPAAAKHYRRSDPATRRIRQAFKTAAEPSTTASIFRGVGKGAANIGIGIADYGNWAAAKIGLADPADYSDSYYTPSNAAEASMMNAAYQNLPALLGARVRSGTTVAKTSAGVREAGLRKADEIWFNWPKKRGKPEPAPERFGGPTFPDEFFTADAPHLVVPGTFGLQGWHINDRGRVEPWIAHYDDYGRLDARTDFNAGNKADGKPRTHYHTFGWARGETAAPKKNHVPGVYITPRRPRWPIKK